MSAIIPPPPQSAVTLLSSLPNELLDLIFAHLNNEVRAFIFSRGTSKSAFKALWKVYCRDLLPTNATADSKALTENASFVLAKPQRMLQALSQISTSFTPPTILSLGIPTSRLEYDEFKLHIRLLPATWSFDRTRGFPPLEKLFMRLEGVEDLRLLPLHLPRRHPMPYEKGETAYDTIQLPSSVRKLFIEEMSSPDFYSTEILEAHPTRNANDATQLMLVNTMKDFGGFSKIQTFHYRTPLPEEACKALQKATNLKEFRLDMLNGEALSRVDLRRIVRDLGANTQCHTLDLRYAFDKAMNPFYGFNWHVLAPQIQAVRMPVEAFGHAIRHSRPEDNVRFELLFDFNRVLDDAESSMRKAARRNPSSNLEQQVQDAEELVRVIKFTTEEAKKLQELIGWLQKRWDVMRAEGYLERRSVKLVDCQWPDSDMGGAWLSDKHEFILPVSMAIGATYI